MIRWTVVLLCTVVVAHGTLTDGNWDSDFVVVPFSGGSSSPTQINRRLLKDGSYRPMYGAAYDVLDPTSGHLVVYPPRDGCLGGQLSLPLETAIHNGGCDVSMNAGFYDVENHTCLGYVVNNGKWETPLYTTTNLPGHRPAANVAHSVFMILEGVPCIPPINTSYTGSEYLSLLETAKDDSHTCAAYVFGFVNATDAVLLRPHIQQAVSGQVWLVRGGSAYVSQSLFGTVPYVYSDAQYEAVGGTHTYFKSLGDANYFRRLIAPRLAIGRRVVDGVSVLSVMQIDGYNGDGVDLDTLASTLLSMGFTDAINLDGGGSVAVYEGGSIPRGALSRDDLRASILNGTVGGRLGTAVNTPSNDCSGASYPRHKCPRPVASMLCLRVAACPNERNCLSTTHSITVVNNLVRSFNNQVIWMLVLLTILAVIAAYVLRFRSR